MKDYLDVAALIVDAANGSDDPRMVQLLDFVLHQMKNDNSDMLPTLLLRYGELIKKEDEEFEPQLTRVRQQ